MIIQEEKVEIVEEEKPKALQKINEPNSQNKNPKHTLFYVLIFFISLLLILLIIFGGFAIYNINNNNKIAKGVSIYGIDVSGKTKAEALIAVSEKFDSIKNTDIKLVSKDYETAINPTEINLSFDINSAINYAFSIGKSGKLFKDNYEIFNTMINEVNITPSYSLDEKLLISTLDKMSKDLPNAVVESSYYIEKSNLIITKGSDGYSVDSAKTAADIKSRIKDFSYLSSPIQISLINQKPKEVDIDKIYNEVHKEAKDAYYTTNPYAVYPSENGVDFKISLAEAKQ